MKSTTNLILTTFLLVYSFSSFSQITDTGGHVGIGTTNPKEKLHINGNLYMNAGEGFKVFGDSNYFGQYQDGIIFQMEDTNATGGNTDGGFVFRGHTPTDNITQNWMVIKSGGKVGIGTTNPSAKLQVMGGIGINTSLTGNFTSGSVLAIGDSDTGLKQQGDGNLAIYSNNVERIRVNNAGNVGIGTTTPDAKLTVKGNIHTREVKVTVSAGADFVFEENYNLTSLDLLESYIIQHKHLPEIASAKEMEEDGILLSEMNIKLLQKIEELTLYTIEQEKEIKALKFQNQKHQALEKRLQKLEKLLLKNN